MQTPNLPQQKQIGFAQGLGVSLRSVSPTVGRPAMSLNGEAQSTKFPDHYGTVGFRLQGRGPGIAMAIDDIAGVSVNPAAGVIDQARGVERLENLRQALRVVLPPTFVEEDPQDDGGMI